MSGIQICRICLVKGVKMYHYNEYNLKHYYEEIILKNDLAQVEGLPQYFCYMCSALLLKFYKFKQKCHTGEFILQQLLLIGPITINSVKQLGNCDGLQLKLVKESELIYIESINKPDIKIENENDVDASDAQYVVKEEFKLDIDEHTIKEENEPRINNECSNVNQTKNNECLSSLFPIAHRPLVIKEIPNILILDHASFRQQITNNQNSEPETVLKNPLSVPTTVLKNPLKVPTLVLNDPLKVPITVLKDLSSVPTTDIKDSLKVPTTDIKDSLKVPTTLLKDYLSRPTTSKVPLSQNRSCLSEFVNFVRVFNGNIKQGEDAAFNKEISKTDMPVKTVNSNTTPKILILDNASFLKHIVNYQNLEPTTVLKDPLSLPTTVSKDSLKVPTTVLKDSLKVPTTVLKGSLKVPTTVLKDSLKVPTTSTVPLSQNKSCLSEFVNFVRVYNGNIKQGEDAAFNKETSKTNMPVKTVNSNKYKKQVEDGGFNVGKTDKADANSTKKIKKKPNVKRTDEPKHIKRMSAEKRRRMEKEMNRGKEKVVIQKRIALLDYYPKKHKELNSNHWIIANLTKEEALQKFNSKAKDPKYIEATYKCEDCLRRFSKEKMLVLHLKLRHSESVGSFECRFCKQRFNKRFKLLSHYGENHYYRYECLRCDFKSTKEQSATIHNMHHEGYLKKCEECQQEFRHQSSYYSHLRRQHRSNYACTYCGNSYKSTLGLQQHIKIKHFDVKTSHVIYATNTNVVTSDEVNTYCERCNIKFVTKDAYDVHFLWSSKHDKESENKDLPVRKRKRGQKIRPKSLCPETVCSVCKKVFPSYTVYSQHHLEEHKDVPLPTVSKTRIQWNICGPKVQNQTTPAPVKLG